MTCYFLICTHSLKCVQTELDHPFLTQDIEDVAVSDGTIFVLHHAGVVSSV